MNLPNGQPATNVPGYSVEGRVEESNTFEPIRHIATAWKGRCLLSDKRVGLNLPARCSGVATACVRAVKDPSDASS